MLLAATTGAAPSASATTTPPARHTTVATVSIGALPARPATGAGDRDLIDARRAVAAVRVSRDRPRTPPPPARPATTRPMGSPRPGGQPAYTGRWLPPAGDESAIAAYALSQVGQPYVFGGATPGGWDCSGLAMAAAARAGVRLPHSSSDQLGYGTPVSRDQLRPGDLVWPAGPGHVQVYVGGGRVVEAPQPGQAVHVTTMWGFTAARRLTRPGG